MILCTYLPIVRDFMQISPPDPDTVCGMAATGDGIQRDTGTVGLRD